MTEKELIDEGFERVEVNDEESQNGYDYYYYRKTIAYTDDLILISSDSDESSNDNWYVKNFDWPCVKIISIEDVRILENLMQKWHA